MSGRFSVGVIVCASVSPVYGVAVGMVSGICGDNDLLVGGGGLPGGDEGLGGGGLVPVRSGRSVLQ